MLSHCFLTLFALTLLIVNVGLGAAFTGLTGIAGVRLGFRGEFPVGSALLGAFYA